MNNFRQIRIVITGPESTGKTTLATQLSERFGGLYVPEYAREYVEKLTGHYTFADVENIARKQVDQYAEANKRPEKMVFFDTWLIITKVWFEWSFRRVPEWLDEAMRNCPVDLYLLCLPDLPWEADPVRENGGENRLKLFNCYRDELIQRGFPFVEIGGTNDVRLTNAIDAVRKFSGEK